MSHSRGDFFGVEFRVLVKRVCNSEFASIEKAGIGRKCFLWRAQISLQSTGITSLTCRYARSIAQPMSWYRAIDIELSVDTNPDKSRQ